MSNPTLEVFVVTGRPGEHGLRYVPFTRMIERMARYRYSRQVMPVPAWDDLLSAERQGWLDMAATMLRVALGEDT